MALKPFIAIPKNLRQWTTWIKEALVEGSVSTNEIESNAVTLAKLAQLGALSLLGNATNATTNVAAIAAASNDTFLRRVSDALAFGQLTAGMFPNTVVPNAALQASVAIKSAASYTASLTGCTTVPTGSVAYAVSGNIVVLVVPSITGTSNSIGATLSGAPAAIRPTSSRTILARIEDNGAVALGIGTMDSSGVLTLGNGVGGGAFTNSGNKGIAANTLVYGLT